jgi:hypothetical protein
MSARARSRSPLPGRENQENPHRSANRWRHQESSAFSNYEYLEPAAAGQARPATATGTTGDLASFINKSSRVEPDSHSQHGGGGNYQPLMVASGHAEGNNLPHDAPEDGRHDPNADGKEIVCGPLLNYRHMEGARWHGSVLIVVKGGGSNVLFQPTLILRRVGATNQLPSGVAQTNGEVQDETGGHSFESHRLYSDVRNTFWAFDIDVPIESTEVQWEYFVPECRFQSEEKPKTNRFFVAASSESMRLMFHSCNGFSVGTDEDAWSGACLWNDVMRKHEAAPYHAMLGGGDQIYNDGIRVNGPLRKWTEIANPQKRRDFPFPETLRAECDDYYLKNYIRWYNTAPFSYANGQIPQVNIWDDHDVSA